MLRLLGWSLVLVHVCCCSRGGTHGPFGCHGLATAARLRWRGWHMHAYMYYTPGARHLPWPRGRVRACPLHAARCCYPAGCECGTTTPLVPRPPRQRWACTAVPLLAGCMYACVYCAAVLPALPRVRNAHSGPGDAHQRPAETLLRWVDGWVGGALGVWVGGWVGAAAHLHLDPGPTQGGLPGASPALARSCIVHLNLNLNAKP